MALPTGSSWDLLDWVSTDITDGTDGLIPQIGAGASAQRPGLINVSGSGVRFVSNDGLLTDFVLPITVPSRFTIEFSGTFIAPDDAFSSTTNMLAIGAQDADGETGLVFMSGNNDSIYLQSPVSGSIVNLGSAATPLRNGKQVTFRLIVDGVSRVVNVYATETAAVAASGHILRGTLATRAAGTSMDFVSVYANGTVANPSSMILTSLGLSSRLLQPSRRPVANVSYSEAAGIREVVYLDGSGSYDLAGDPITHSWSIVTQPTDSDILLSGMTRASVTVNGIVFTSKEDGTVGNGVIVRFDSGGGVFAVSTGSEDGNALILITPKVVNGIVRSTKRDVILALSTPTNAGFNRAAYGLVTTALASGGDEFDNLVVSQEGELTGGSDSNLSAVSFIPAVMGTYEISLVVSNGSLASLPSQATIYVVPNALTTGYTPDASYLWTYISDFWRLVRDRGPIDMFWSALTQRVAAELLEVLQTQDERSLDHFPEDRMARWVSLPVRVSMPSHELVPRPYVDYTITPYAYSGNEITTDMFYINDGTSLSVGDRIGWSGQLLTIVHVGDDDVYGAGGGPLHTIDSAVLPVYTVIDSGTGARAIDDFDSEDFYEHDETSSTVHLDVGSFDVPASGTSYLWIMAAAHLIESSNSYEIHIENTNELPVSKAHTTFADSYYDYDAQDHILFVAKGDEYAGNGITIRLIEDVVVSGTCTVFEFTLTEAGANFESDGVAVGDLVILDPSGAAEQHFVAAVGETTLTLDSMSALPGSLAYTVYLSPGLVRVVPSSRTIEVTVAGDYPAFSEVQAAVNDPDHPNYSVDADSMVTVYVGDGHEDDVATVGVYYTSSGIRSEFLDWQILQLAGEQTISRGTEIVFEETQEELYPVTDDGIEFTEAGETVSTASLVASSDDVLIVDDCYVAEIALTHSRTNTAISVLPSSMVEETVTDSFTLPTAPTDANGAAIEIRVGDIVIYGALELMVSSIVGGVYTVVRRYNATLDAAVLPAAGTVTYLVHRNRIKVDDDTVSIPYLQEVIKVDEALLGTDDDPRLREGVDFDVADGWVMLRSPLSIPDRLWAEIILTNNSDAISSNFGIVVGLPRSSFESDDLQSSYLTAVKGLTFVLFRGPSYTNVRIAGQVFCNLPIAESAGTITEILPDFDLVENLGRITIEDADTLSRSYYYPRTMELETNPDTELPWEVGDTIERFQPLCTGVLVRDYISHPYWYRDYINEVRKFHVFHVCVDSRVLNPSTTVLLPMFLKTIRPAHTEVIVGVAKVIEEDVGKNEDLWTRVQLGFRDDRYTCEDSLSGDLRVASPSRIEFVADYLTYLQRHVVFSVNQKIYLLPPSRNALDVAGDPVEYTITDVSHLADPTPNVIVTPDFDVTSGSCVIAGAVLTDATAPFRSNEVRAGFSVLIDGTEEVAITAVSSDGMQLTLVTSPTNQGAQTYEVQEDGVGFQLEGYVFPPFESGYNHGFDGYDGEGSWHGNQVNMVCRRDSAVGDDTTDLEAQSLVGPDTVIASFLVGARSYANDQASPQAFDHICYRDGRQKDHFDRFTEYSGPECLPNVRVCTLFGSDDTYPGSRATGSGTMNGAGLILTDGTAAFTGDVVPGMAVSLESGGVVESRTVLVVGATTLTLTAASTYAGLAVDYRVYPVLVGPSLIVDAIQDYDEPSGEVPKRDSVYQFDRLTADTSNSVVLAGHVYWDGKLVGPSVVTSFLLNSVPDFESGYYAWHDLKVRDANGADVPYTDEIPSGPGGTVVWEDCHEPRWGYDDTGGTLVSNTSVCTVKAFSVARTPRISKYP